MVKHRVLLLLQNLSSAELDAVLAAYAPLDEDGINRGKIAIANMYGDVVYVCFIQQAARVSARTRNIQVYRIAVATPESIKIAAVHLQKTMVSCKKVRKISVSVLANECIGLRFSC